VCLDPWLTGRRACCPLCKADYYVPKPRSEGEANNDSTGRRSNGMRLNMPQAPQSTWLGGRYMPARSRMIILTTNRGMGDSATSRTRSTRRTGPSASTEATNANENSGWRSRLPTFLSRGAGGSSFSPFRRRDNNASATTATSNPTPAQLEAGVR